MKCPSCKDGSLKPAWLEPNLPAYRCDVCSGTLLQLIAWRAWRELGASVGKQTHCEEQAADSAHALQCPRCERLMVKFRYQTDSNRRLDICTHCEDVWLDKGEWDALKGRALHGDLPSIFSEPWQRDLHVQMRRERAAEYWANRLGEQAAEARQLRDWLNAQPNRREILLYLMDREVD